jgi:nitrate/nitrite transport system substrate-binding protein
MLCGQPIGATIGYLGQADMITPLSMDLNGNAATVSNDLWAKMQEHDPRLKEPGHAHPISAASLLPIAKERAGAGNPLRLAMVFPVSCHNYELRYWLAAGGVSPGFYNGYNDPVGTSNADVLLSVTPPPQMVQTLTQNTIDGYCVGEPWNQQAVKDKVGVPVFTDAYIWKNNPEKVFGMTKAFAAKNPNTVIGITKALIRAGYWLDESRENRIKAVEMLANKDYIGANPEVLGASMLGTFEFQQGDKRPLPDFNVFYRYNATYPLQAHCVWYLTQMRRWGQIPENKSDAWYHETAASIYRPDIYRIAYDKLIAEKLIPVADLPTEELPIFPAEDFIDRIAFDAKQPNAYLKSFTIGQK